MARELELLTYEATMARCSNSALKLLIWWGNNIGGGTMLISENELKESADLAIAYWKKQIVLCPNINGNDKEWGKEFVETIGKKGVGKTESEMGGAGMLNTTNTNRHKCPTNFPLIMRQQLLVFALQMLMCSTSESQMRKNGKMLLRTVFTVLAVHSNEPYSHLRILRVDIALFFVGSN